MTSYNLNMPFDKETVCSIRVRGLVTLNGRVFGLRDKILIHIFNGHNELPVVLVDYPVLHMAPSLKETDKGWEKIVIGTTTSIRMGRFTPATLTRGRPSGWQRFATSNWLNRVAVRPSVADASRKSTRSLRPKLPPL